MITETTELAVYDAVSVTIAQYKAENANLVFDYADKQGAKDAKSHIAKLRKAKTAIATVHKDAKAEAWAFGKRLDAKKNELCGEVDEMINVHKDPMDKIEAEKIAVALAKAEALEAEKALVESEKQAELDARETEIRAKEQEIWEAEDKLRKEQEALAQKEREKEIAENAAREATIRAEADAKARTTATIAKYQAKELAEKKRKEAEAAKEQKRIQDKSHRQDVESKILNSLTAAMFNPDIAYTILTMLKENKIPNVTINY